MQSEVDREWIAGDIRQDTVEVLREKILNVLTERFQVIGQPLRDTINTIEDAGVLRAILRRSSEASSLDEFESLLLIRSAIFREWAAEELREAESRGYERTMRESILDLLTERFCVVRQPLRDKIDTVGDRGILKALLKWSVRASTLEEFEGQLDKLISA